MTAKLHIDIGKSLDGSMTLFPSRGKKGKGLKTRSCNYLVLKSTSPHNNNVEVSQNRGTPKSFIDRWFLSIWGIRKSLCMDTTTGPSSPASLT